MSPASLPYSPGAELRLWGENLAAEHVKVTIGELASLPIGGTESELRVLLPAGTQAGTSLVRVIHERPGGAERRWHVASNPAAVVIQPVVLAASWRPEPGDAPPGRSGGAGRRVLIEVGFAPPVAAASEVEILLNLSPSPDEPISRRGYLFRGTADPTAPDRLEIAATVAAGRYLVRVRIAGVDSLLAVDDDPASPTFERFIGPAIEVG